MNKKKKSKPIYWARSPIKKSTGHLLAGQPGAGKTKLADIFTRQHNGNIVFVSSDDYRKYHPRYGELQASYGDDAVLHTQKFAGKMTEALKRYQQK